MKNMKSEITLKEVYERLVLMEAKMNVESGTIQQQISSENNAIMKRVRKYVLTTVGLIALNLGFTLFLVFYGNR